MRISVSLYRFFSSSPSRQISPFSLKHLFPKTLFLPRPNFFSQRKVTWHSISSCSAHQIMGKRHFILSLYSYSEKKEFTKALQCDQIFSIRFAPLKPVKKEKIHEMVALTALYFRGPLWFRVFPEGRCGSVLKDTFHSKTAPSSLDIQDLAKKVEKNPGSFSITYANLFLDEGRQEALSSLIHSLSKNTKNYIEFTKDRSARS